MRQTPGNQQPYQNRYNQQNRRPQQFRGKQNYNPNYRDNQYYQNNYDRNKYDSEYGFETLEQFRNQIEAQVHYSSGRNKILSLFTGQKNQSWLITEIIGIMDSLVQFHGGIVFISNIHHKLLFRSNEWSNALFHYFNQILLDPVGFELYHTIISDIPQNQIVPFSQLCFDQFMRVDDPELFGLISALIQLISTSYPNLYSNLCNLQLYLPRPQATLVARTLIEYGEESTIEQFVDDIESKLFDLIHAQDLSEVISSLLIRGPQKRRESIFNKLSPIFNDMIMNPYQWKILHTLLSVVSMRQKINLATIIVQSVSFPSKPPYLDILIIHALESVDMQSRIQLWHNNMALVHDPQLTRVPEYLARLEKRMLALRNEYTKM